MKVAILDDGWQKEKSRTYYSATGDWRPVPSRFPDMKAHVAAVHDAGLKYMLWLSVPFIGDESGAWAVFKDKCLFTTDDGVGRLDPRFPEVRKYLVGTYERVVGEWGFDGVKLDFIDEFSLRGRKDPAVAQGYAGRDIRSLPEAVDRLMKEVVSRLRAIRPDVLIEFRQQYMGPAVRQYGNMIRATDCPADLAANRRRVADLRLTSGKTAVHSDMLVWSADETPENAARAVLSAIFGVVQYSMVLQSVPESHREMMRHWIAFSTKHRNALLKGGFRPHHPEMQYPWIESWDGSEHIVAAYAENLVLPVVAAGKDVYVLNASQEPSLVLDVKGRAEAAEVFDTFGQSKGVRTLAAGLNRIAVPVGGYAKVEATDVSWPMERLKSPPRVHDASTYRTNGVEVAFLEGLQYKGRPTRIFCYWGVPEHKKGEKVPGVVLVHGGAGSAFYRWVKYWNSRGYAAVSMDTCGSVSGNVVGSEQRRHFRHEWGGPSGWGGFDTLDAPVEDQWMYHAVADAVICNSFLRSLDGVDPGRIGITGVSWGGVITCIAASVDDRFAFAAPVYGCGGFLRNSPMWTGEVAKMGDKVYEWESLWDPLRYLRGLKTPVLWLTGTNDRAFSLPSLMESHASVGCEKHLSVKVRLVHTHGPVSENSPEVEAFADSFCKGSRPLAELGDVSFDVTSRRASCEVSGGAGAVKAWLVYTADVGAWEKRKWHAVDARVESDGRCVSAEVPAGVAVFYFNVVDDRGLVAATRAVSASVVVEGADSPVRRNCVVRLAAD